jgi:hypothetical protein
VQGVYQVVENGRIRFHTYVTKEQRARAAL